MHILLSSASTKVVVNGVLGRKINHAKSLRQGDSISPLLFVIAMDTLTTLLTEAAKLGVLSRFTSIPDLQGISIYADDVVIFMKPNMEDLPLVRRVLHISAEASGLRVNFHKTSAVIIREMKA